MFTGLNTEKSSTYSVHTKWKCYFVSLFRQFFSHFLFHRSVAFARVTQFKGITLQIEWWHFTTYTIHSAIKWSVKKWTYWITPTTRLCAKNKRLKHRMLERRDCSHRTKINMSSFNQQFSGRWLSALLCICVMNHDWWFDLHIGNYQLRKSKSKAHSMLFINQTRRRPLWWCCMCGLFLIF